MNNLTIAEKFPILARISEVPIEACRAAYETLDDMMPGKQTDDLNKFMRDGGSTRRWLELCFDHKDTSARKPKDLEEFALGTEYAFRLSKT
jgi:hypothetical protein